MKHFCAFAALLISAAALSSRADAQAECKRPAPRQFTQGETVVLSETKTFPCKIVFAETPIALRSDANPSITAFGQSVARGPDGRLYTSSPRGADVHVWSPAGQFERILGRAGGAPGEFAPGQKTIELGRDGRVYVLDMHHRWSVFGPTLAFERTIAANATGRGFLTSEGLLVSSGREVVQTGTAFAVFDFAPTPDGHPRVVRQFGTPIMGGSRITTPSAGLNFWAAPRDGPGAVYEVELWRTDGTLLRTIRRDVPWFPRVAATPSTEIEVLNDDGTGIVFVGLMIPNAEKFVAAEKETDPVKRRALQDASIDIYLEAIDGNAGVVLASWGPFHPSEAMKTMPTGFIPRSRAGYRMDKAPNGVSVARIVDLKLVAN